MAATSKKRKPGRRHAPSEQASEKHEKLITEAQKVIDDLESEKQAAMNELASRIDAACNDGVKTEDIADTLGKSRQMVYKMIRERVDKLPMNARSNGKVSQKKNPFQTNAKKKKSAPAKIKKVKAKS